MAGEQLRSGDDFLCDDCRKLGGLLLEERRESIDVGECIVRSPGSKIRRICPAGSSFRTLTTYVLKDGAQARTIRGT